MNGKEESKGNFMDFIEEASTDSQNYGKNSSMRFIRKAKRQKTS